MHQQQLKIKNGIIITPHTIIHGGTILITGDVITAISKEEITAEDVVEIDAQGNYIAPGFIDIHVHGGSGADFMEGDEAGFLKIAATHAQYGTTAMLPTTLTSSKEELLQTLMVYEKADKNNLNGAQFLGLHLEGPYISMNQRGAQDSRYTREPDPDEYKEILSRSASIKHWSAARN